jgi:alpha/beta superfamily hydrolase
MRFRRFRRISHLCLVVAITATLTACNGEGPARHVGGEVAIDAQEAPNLPQTVRLLGIERGRGTVGVVLAHMLNSSQSAWSPLVDRLVAKDFHVLTFDFRGHGISGGTRDPARAGLDLTAAVAKLRSLGASKIFVVGASMGGTAAIVVAATEKLEGVVSISAPLEIGGLNASDAVARLDEPSLFIVGEKDDKRYTDAARTFASRAPEPKHLSVIAGASGHGTDLIGASGKTKQTVLDLIVDFLITNRG